MATKVVGAKVVETASGHHSIPPDQPYILVLPEELFITIFSNLGIADLQKLSLVCKDFKRIADDDTLRKIFFIRDFPTRNPIDLIFRNALRRRNNSTTPATTGRDCITWKDQYKYAYQMESNLKKGICRSDIVSGIGHQQRITCFASKGPYFLSGSFDGKIVIRRQDIENPVQTLNCEEGVFCLSDEHLVSKFQETLQVWVSGKEAYEQLQTLNCDGSTISEFSLQNDHLIARSENGVLKVWKKNEERKFAEVLSLSDVCCFHAKDDYLFLAMNDEKISILKKDEKGIFNSQQVIESSSPSALKISWLNFENGHLITGCIDGGIKIWKVNEGGIFAEPQTISGMSVFGDLVSEFIVQGDYIIMGFLKGNLSIYKKDENGSFYHSQTLSEHSERINSIQLKGDYLLSGSTDTSAKIWKMDQAGKFNKVRDLQGEEKGITCVRIEGDQFFVGYSDGTFRIWDFTHQIAL